MIIGEELAVQTVKVFVELLLNSLVESILWLDGLALVSTLRFMQSTNTSLVVVTSFNFLIDSA